MVVKKKKGTIIDNDIGILFKRHNIIEYKNPKDELNIDTLWKVIGYIGIYKSLGKRVNAIPETEIAAFIFRSVKPSKLLEQLVDLGHQVIMMADGIYSIQGLVSVPLVIIVMNELTDAELRALKIMTSGADEEEIREFVYEAKSIHDPEDKRNIDAVIQVMADSNPVLFNRLKEDQDMCEALRELMADELKEAEINGIKQRDIEKISEMLNMGRKPEDIAEFCNYPLQQVKNVQKSLKKK